MGVLDKTYDSLYESDMNVNSDVQLQKKAKSKRKSLFEIVSDVKNVPDKEQQEALNVDVPDERLSDAISSEEQNQGNTIQKESKKSKFIFFY